MISVVEDHKFHTATKQAVNGGYYALRTWHWTGSALQIFVKYITNSQSLKHKVNR